MEKKRHQKTLNLKAYLNNRLHKTKTIKNMRNHRAL